MSGLQFFCHHDQLCPIFFICILLDWQLSFQTCLNGILGGGGTGKRGYSFSFPIGEGGSAHGPLTTIGPFHTWAPQCLYVQYLVWEHQASCFWQPLLAIDFHKRRFSGCSRETLRTNPVIVLVSLIAHENPGDRYLTCKAGVRLWRKIGQRSGRRVMVTISYHLRLDNSNGW